MFSNFAKGLLDQDAVTIPELAKVLKSSHTPVPTIEVVRQVTFPKWVMIGF